MPLIGPPSPGLTFVPISYALIIYNNTLAGGNQDISYVPSNLIVSNNAVASVCEVRLNGGSNNNGPLVSFQDTNGIYGIIRLVNWVGDDPHQAIVSAYNEFSGGYFPGNYPWQVNFDNTASTDPATLTILLVGYWIQ